MTNPGERATVAQFRAEVGRQSEIERTAADRPKRGLRLSAQVVNPFNGAAIPLFLANYVLMGYGTGAIMAVPGEDKRDLEFAEQYGLPIIETVKRPDGWTGKAYTGDGVKINSGFLDGLTVAAAKRQAIDWLVSRGLGTGKVNYRLRDWGDQPPALLGRTDPGDLLRHRRHGARVPRRTSRSRCRATCSSRARAARRWRASPASSTPPVPMRRSRRGARPTPWTPS